MQVFKVFTVAILAATVSVGAANAQGRHMAAHPAEFPPSSFKGKQYVDSKGCIFIRAGFSGNVTWVPRLTRGRKHMCGQRPTYAKAPVPNAPVVVAAKPALKPVPKRVVRKIAKPAPAPMPTVYTRSKPAITAVRPMAPRRVVRRVIRQPVPVVAAKPAVKRGIAQRPATACKGASVLSQRYINSGRNGVVRCGPQAENPAGRIVYSGNQTAAMATTRTYARRLAAPKPTRAVAIATAKQQRVVTTQRVVRRVATYKPPAGHRVAWKDGRLNQNRAKGSAQGRAQMEMVWTNTVPRRLVAVSTSQDTRRRVVLRKTASGQRATVASVSTKGAPITRKAVSAASHRYVQVGSYGNAANASKTIARLRGMGLPVRVSKTNSGGRILQTVMAGPFNRQASLNSALAATRRAGYRDAILRR